MRVDSRRGKYTPLQIAKKVERERSSSFNLNKCIYSGSKNALQRQRGNWSSFARSRRRRIKKGRLGSWEQASKRWRPFSPSIPFAGSDKVEGRECTFPPLLLLLPEGATGSESENYSRTDHRQASSTWQAGLSLHVFACLPGILFGLQNSPAVEVSHKERGS